MHIMSMDAYAMYHICSMCCSYMSSVTLLVFFLYALDLSSELFGYCAALVVDFA